MRPFELLKKAVEHPAFGKEENGLDVLITDLVSELDRDLTIEEYDWESPKIIDICDNLEAELKDVDESDDEDDEEDDADALDDDDDDDDDFEGIDDDDEDVG